MRHSSALWLALLLVMGGAAAAAPATSTIAGRVVDPEGAPLPGAIVVVAGTQLGAATGMDGRYTVSAVPPGAHEVECSLIGYGTQSRRVALVAGEPTRLDFRMAEEVIRLSAITVTPSRFAIMGNEPHARQALTEEQIQSLPHLGEDIYRAVTRLPGISASDYSAKFTVRGGEHDEVLVLLDGLQLYEPFHLKDIAGGALSIVDVAAIEGIDLLTGAFPAEYGDRLSGVFQIRSRRPQAGGARHAVGISFMNTRAMSQGTFEGGSWLVSVRRGYLDLVLRLMNEDEAISPNYYDALAKVEYDLTPGQRLSVHGLYARDDFELVEDDDDESETGYGNGYLWANLISTLGPSMVARTTLATGRVSTDRVGVGVRDDRTAPDYEVVDERRFRFYGARQAWSWEPSTNQFLKWGVDYRRLLADYDYRSVDHVYRWIPPDSMSVHADTIAVMQTPRGHHVGAYLADRFRLTESLTAEAGLRFDDVTHTDDRLWSPRLNAVYTIGDATTVRAGWGRFTQSQGMHEMRVEDGEDTFLPAERAEHWVLGVERQLDEHTNLRLEAYEKEVSEHRPEYRNWGNDIEIFPELLDDRLRVDLDGTTARGLEAYIKRDATGKLTWWASYALARVRERVVSVASGDGTLPFDRTVPGVYDQRHTVYVDVNYRPSTRWHLNLAWQYRSGWPYTGLVAASETIDGSTYWFATPGEAQGSRYPAFHRVDLRLSRYFETSSGRVAAFAELINLYNRGNVQRYEYYFRCREAVGCKLFEAPEYGLRLLPSIGVSWSWGSPTP